MFRLQWSLCRDSRGRGLTAISEMSMGSPKCLRTKWSVWITARMARICICSNGKGNFSGPFSYFHTPKEFTFGGNSVQERSCSGIWPDLGLVLPRLLPVETAYVPDGGPACHREIIRMQRRNERREWEWERKNKRLFNQPQWLGCNGGMWGITAA